MKEASPFRPRHEWNFRQTAAFHFLRNPLVQHTWVAAVHFAFRVKKQGEECVPARRPLIFPGNHASHYDGLISSAAVFRIIGESPSIVVWGGVRRMPLTREMAETGAIPLILVGEARTPASGARAVSEMTAHLAAGRSLVMHAEGHRCDRLGPFKPGAAFAALRTGTPIVPFTLRGVLGLWNEMPKPNHWRGHVSIHYHPPIDPADYAHLPTREAVAEITAELRRRVASAIDYPDECVG